MGDDTEYRWSPNRPTLAHRLMLILFVKCMFSAGGNYVSYMTHVDTCVLHISVLMYIYYFYPWIFSTKLQHVSRRLTWLLSPTFRSTLAFPLY